MTRLFIYLEDDELIALQKTAKAEIRHLRDQARVILREGLIQRGTLPKFDSVTHPKKPKPGKGVINAPNKKSEHFRRSTHPSQKRFYHNS